MTECDMGHITGNIKLKSDPRVFKFTDCNILYCGAKLFTDSVIGMVLFTGRDTKILMQTETSKYFLKETLVKRTYSLNVITYLVGLMASVTFLFAVGKTLLLLTNQQERVRMEQFLNMGSFQVVIFSIFSSYEKLSQYIPALLFLCIEVGVLVGGILFPLPGCAFKNVAKGGDCQSNSMTVGPEEDTQSIFENSNRAHREGTLIDGKKSILDNDLVRNLNAADQSGRNLALPKSDNESSCSAGSSKISNMDTIKHKLSIGYLDSMLNFTGPDHMIFGKTDTLTSSTMRIARITSSVRDYQFVLKEGELRDVVEAAYRNLSKFVLPSSDDELMHELPDDYSEKSQEVIEEYDCDYSEEEFEEQQNHNAISDMLGKLEESKLGKQQPGTRVFGKKVTISELRLPEKVPVVTAPALEQTQSPIKIVTQELPSISMLTKLNSKSSVGTTKQQLPLKIGKTKTEAYMLSDLIKQNKELEELLAYLMIFYYIDTGYQKRSGSKDSISLEYMAYEQLLNDYGFEIERLLAQTSITRNTNHHKNKNASPNLMPQGHSHLQLRVFNRFGFQATYHIKAVNRFTNRRKKSSIIISDNRRGAGFYSLIVKAKDYELTDYMNLDEKGISKFKFLGSQYKNLGYRQVVFASRPLTPSEYFNFAAAMEKPPHNNQDHIDEVDKVLFELERGLWFIGSLGIVEKLRSGAEPLITRLVEDKVDMSILSGDSLHTCLYVTQQLKIAYIDINDSSGYRHLHIEDEISLKSKVKRILEELWAVLKHQKLKVGGMEDEDLNMLERISDLKRESEDFQMLSRKVSKISTGKDVAQPQQQLGIYNMVVDHHQGIIKPLLINGSIVNIIKQSKDTNLEGYFKIVLHLSSSVIGYELNNDSKAYLTDLIRELKGNVVAVGNGFNDMGMLSCSNVGIQIKTDAVPLGLADWYVYSMKNISQILFWLSPVATMKFSLSVILAVWISGTYLPVLVFYQSMFSSVLKFPPHYVHLLSIILAIELLFFSGCYKSSLFEKSNPQLQGSRDSSIKLEILCKRFKNNVKKHLVLFFLLGLVEGMYIFMISRMFSSYSALQFELDNAQLTHMFVWINVLILHKIKLHLVYRFIGLVTALTSLVTLFLMFLVILRAVTSGLISSPIQGLLFIVTERYSLSLIGCLLLPCFCANWLTITIFRRLMLDFHKSRSMLISKGNLQTKISTLDGLEPLVHKIRRISNKTMIRGILRKVLRTDSVSRHIGLKQIFSFSTITTVRSSIKNQLKMSNLVYSRKILIFFFGLAFVEYIGVLIGNGSIQGQLHSGIPFGLLSIVIAYLSTFLVDEIARLQGVMAVCLWVSLAVQIVITFVHSKQNWKILPISLTRVAFSLKHLKSLTVALICLTASTFFLVDFYMMPEAFYCFGSIGLFTKFTVGVATVILFLKAIVLNRKGKQIDYHMNYTRLHLTSELNESKDLLSMLMPSFVVKRLHNFQIAKNFLADDAGDVAVLFCDVCYFDDIIKKKKDKVITMLDEIFRCFDNFCSVQGVQKIETVGKTYMATAGLKIVDREMSKDLQKKNPVERVLLAAMDMQQFMSNYYYSETKKVQIKIGIHYGTCIFGVLGYHKPQFSLIGDTINTTSRHCTTGETGKIILSEEAWKHVNDNRVFNFEVEEVEMKGKGKVPTYVLSSENPQAKEANRRGRMSKTEILVDPSEIGIRVQHFIDKNLEINSPESLDANSLPKKKSISINPMEVASQMRSPSVGQERVISNRHMFAGIRRLTSSFDSQDFVHKPQRILNETPSMIAKNLQIPSINSLYNQNGERKQSNLSRDLASSPSNIRNESNMFRHQLSNMLQNTWRYFIDIVGFYKNPEYSQKKKFMKESFSNVKGFARLALLLSYLPFVLWEVAQWPSSRQANTATFRTLNFLNISLVLVVHLISFLRSSYSYFFYITTSLLLLRAGSRVSELLSLAHSDKSTDPILFTKYIELLFDSALISTYLTLSGLYFLFEGVLANLVLLITVLVGSFYTLETSQAFMVSIFWFSWMVFNLIDMADQSDRQFEVFTEVSNLDRENTYMYEFVDRLLPKQVRKVISTGQQRSDFYKDVTILFADIVGFTAYSGGKSPRQVIEMLSRLFTDFDRECNKLRLYKLYTIGDCYVVMSFVDKNSRKNPGEEAQDVVQLGFKMLEIISKVRKQINFDKLDMRIGIHTGEVFGGVIGTEIVRFDIYGQNVVIANKMESGGCPGKICVSESTKTLLEDRQTTNYTYTENSPIFIKAIGKDVQSFFLNTPEEPLNFN